jgi:hypothetical protein
MIRSTPLAWYLHVDGHEVLDHLPLAVLDGSHIDRDRISANAKRPGTRRQGSERRTVDDVLTRQTGHVRTRPAHHVALDQGCPMTFRRQRPRQVLARLSTANDKNVEALDLGHRLLLG